jgi:hypothetical protein
MSVKDFELVCKRCPEDVPRMSQGCPEDVPRMSRDVPGMSRGCPEDVSRMSTELMSVHDVNDFERVWVSVKCYE